MVLLGVTELGVNLPSLVAYLVNFILLLGILGVFAYKPLMRMLDERTERIRESLEAADLARQEAANAQEAIQEQITEARREGQRIMDQTREAAERFRTEEMEKARQEAEALVERARADIQRERDNALEEVRLQCIVGVIHRRHAGYRESCFRISVPHRDQTIRVRIR